ncbi:hypothetical protein [Actinoplanes sp. DH11]|uniref:hypothetical protein n=1 Tax=Actinoplanes sp. DH11 TaxID=2857011 RepID=UPI001E42C95F|nr:hypothetical protein [Actinoplanes sp. DH11]
MQTTVIRLAAGAGLLSLSLAACDSGASSAPSAPSSASAAAAPAGAGPDPSSDAAPSGSPAASASAAEGIPASALLQPGDVRDAEGQPFEQGEVTHVRPLRPCGDAPYASDESRVDAVAMRYIVENTQEGSTPTVVAQFVGRHRPGGAAEQFAEIGAALDRCPGGLGEDEKKWAVLDADDDSMVVRIDERFSYADEAPSTVSHYAAMSRVGDAVVVVADLGWENLGGDEKLVRDLIAKAEERAATIS